MTSRNSGCNYNLWQCRKWQQRVHDLFFYDPLRIVAFSYAASSHSVITAPMRKPSRIRGASLFLCILFVSLEKEISGARSLRKKGEVSRKR